MAKRVCIECRSAVDPDTGPAWERPCAAEGLISYRYPNSYGGWIMIGATNAEHALREAARSTDSPIRRERLQVWRPGGYVDAL
jgi:hypothetical protein